MKQALLIVGVMFIVIVIMGVIYITEITQPDVIPSTKEQDCVNSGGTVRTIFCCLTTNDFPNLCILGPCGCSLENSHEVKICDCGEGKCFNGNICAEIEELEGACISPTGVTMTLDEAKEIALSSDCGDRIKEIAVCNSDTGTWWIDLDIQKEGCNPACVINIETKEAEINWRCMGVTV